MVPPKDGSDCNLLVDMMSWDIIRCIDFKVVSANYKNVIVKQKEI